MRLPCCENIKMLLNYADYDIFDNKQIKYMLTKNE